MRVLIIISYLFSFFVLFGNTFSPELHYNHAHAPASGLIGKALFITAANAIEVIDLDLPDVVEDNPTGGNEDDSSKDFSQNVILQNRWSFCFPEHVFLKTKLLSSVPERDSSTPIYLKNRVLRI